MFLIKTTYESHILVTYGEKKIDEKFECDKHKSLGKVLTKEELTVVYLYCKSDEFCSKFRQHHLKEHDACKFYIFSKFLDILFSSQTKSHCVLTIINAVFKNASLIAFNLCI